MYCLLIIFDNSPRYIPYWYYINFINTMYCFQFCQLPKIEAKILYYSFRMIPFPFIIKMMKHIWSFIIELIIEVFVCKKNKLMINLKMCFRIPTLTPNTQHPLCKSQTPTLELNATTKQRTFNQKMTITYICWHST